MAAGVFYTQKGHFFGRSLAFWGGQLQPDGTHYCGLCVCVSVPKTKKLGVFLGVHCGCFGWDERVLGLNRVALHFFCDKGGPRFGTLYATHPQQQDGFAWGEGVRSIFGRKIVVFMFCSSGQFLWEIRVSSCALASLHRIREVKRGLFFGRLSASKMSLPPTLSSSAFRLGWRFREVGTRHPVDIVANKSPLHALFCCLCVCGMRKVFEGGSFGPSNYRRAG